MTQPLTVALDELRAAAADLHAIAIRLRADVASFSSVSVSGPWRAADASRQSGGSIAAQLAGVIRDLEADQAALDEAVASYRASDKRASARLPRGMRAW